MKPGYIRPRFLGRCRAERCFFNAMISWPRTLQCRLAAWLVSCTIPHRPTDLPTLARRSTIDFLLFRGPYFCPSVRLGCILCAGTGTRSHT